MALVVQHPLTAHSPKQETKELPIAESSFLQHIKYDAANFQLTVTMKNGAQYVHYYVYPSVVDDLFQAPSKGKFYSEAIKGKHPSTRIISKTVGRKTRT